MLTKHKELLCLFIIAMHEKIKEEIKEIKGHPQISRLGKKRFFSAVLEGSGLAGSEKGHPLFVDKLMGVLFSFFLFFFFFFFFTLAQAAGEGYLEIVRFLLDSNARKIKGRKIKGHP